MALDLTKPVQTKDGRKVRIICTDRKTNRNYPNYTVVGLLTEKDGSEFAYLWKDDGESNFGNGNYLVNVPEERWIVVLTHRLNGLSWPFNSIFKSKEEAQRHVSMVDTSFFSTEVVQIKENDSS